MLLDVRKDYNSLDKGRCLEILRGGGLGTKLDRLLTHYWERQRMFPKVGNLTGKEFGTGRVIIQGYPISPMIFNIVVNIGVRSVLDEFCGPQEAYHGMVWATGGYNIILYTNNGSISGRDPK